MSDIDQQVQESVQKVLKEKEDKDKFSSRIFWAILGGILSGYLTWSNLGIFSFFNHTIIWAIGIGAVIGFFISEVMVFAAIALIVLSGYMWFQDAYIPGTSYTINVQNVSSKILSIKTLDPVKCGSWKADKQQYSIVTLLPGETKEAFKGCKASAFNFSLNGVSKYGDLKPKTGSCFELTYSINLVYTEDGWAEESQRIAFGDGNSPNGAIILCKD